MTPSRPLSASSTARPALYGSPDRWGLVHGDALAVLAQLPSASVDAVVTDPPYGIAFNGEHWDGGDLADSDGFQQFTASWATEALRVLKPGGHLAAFGAVRTMHRAIIGVEEAGFEIRDQLLWLFGSAMPKSRRMPLGLGTALKPAYEPILLARKPLIRGLTAQAHVEQHGTGAMDIDGSRIPRPETEPGGGFWPANLALEHDAECATGTGALARSPGRTNPNGCTTTCPVPLVDRLATETRGERGAPLSRLFYSAKATPGEREAGLEHLPKRQRDIFAGNHRGGPTRPRANVHPTVKPIALMRWLVRLVTPTGGTVLDPFAGSGSTGIAALLEDRPFLGLEREPHFVDIAQARLRHWAATSREDPAL